MKKKEARVAVPQNAMRNFAALVKTHENKEKMQGRRERRRDKEAHHSTRALLAVPSWSPNCGYGIFHSKEDALLFVCFLASSASLFACLSIPPLYVCWNRCDRHSRFAFVGPRDALGRLIVVGSATLGQCQRCPRVPALSEPFFFFSLQNKIKNRRLISYSKSDRKGGV